MDVWKFNVECMTEGEAQDLVKKELISDVFMSFFMSLCIIVVGCNSLHFVFNLSAPIYEMVDLKDMTDQVICHLEAFLQSTGRQLRNSIRIFLIISFSE